MLAATLLFQIRITASVTNPMLQPKCRCGFNMSLLLDNLVHQQLTAIYIRLNYRNSTKKGI
jgi:hypothetical protein